MTKYVSYVCPECRGTGGHRSHAGPWLRNRRLRARYTLRKMAQRLDCSPSYLSDIERGMRQCPGWIGQVYEKIG